MNKREADLAMMSDIKRWPRWPILPMKRSTDKGMELGYLYADDPPEVARVHRGGSYAPWDGDYRTDNFESLEAMLDAGWRVD